MCIAQHHSVISSVSVCKSTVLAPIFCCPDRHLLHVQPENVGEISGTRKPVAQTCCGIGNIRCPAHPAGSAHSPHNAADDVDELIP